MQHEQRARAKSKIKTRLYSLQKRQSIIIIKKGGAFFTKDSDNYSNQRRIKESQSCFVFFKARVESVDKRRMTHKA